MKPKPKKKPHPIKVRLRRQQVEVPEPPGRVGRQSGYNPDVHPAVAFYIIFCGGTRHMVAEKLGISYSTLQNWKRKYPEFCRALEVDVNHLLGDVATAVLKRALGYVVEDQEITIKEQFNKELGQVIELREVRTIRKHVPADMGACYFLLANRDSIHWRRSDSAIPEPKESKGVVSEIPTSYLEEVVRESIPKKSNIYDNLYEDTNVDDDEWKKKLGTLVIHDTKQ